MALLQCSRVFSDALSYRSEDVPGFSKILDNTSQMLKQPDVVTELSAASEEEKSLLIRSGVQAYCHSSYSAKLAKSIEKVLKALPKKYSKSVNEELEYRFQELLERKDLSSLQTVSALLDHNSEIKMVSPKYFVEITELVTRCLASEIDQDLTNLQMKKLENMRYTVKLIIQVLQLFPHKVKSLFSCAGCPDDNLTLIDKWNFVLRNLLMLLFQTSSKDLLLLTGTALAMVFNLGPSNSTTVDAYLDVIAILSHEKSSVYFCGVQIDVNVLENKVQDTSVSIIAIIKGLLVSCSKDTLTEGDYPLMLKIFPSIMTACKGPSTHHYLAYQLLALWYRKLKQFKFIYHSQQSLASLAASLNLRGPQWESNVEAEKVEIETGNTKVDDSSSNQDETRKSVSNSKEKNDTDLLASHLEVAHNISHDSAISCDLNSSSQPSESHILQSSQRTSISVMSRHCPILASSLACLWLNWDSPVDGVAQFVEETFGYLLHVWNENVKPRTGDNRDLCMHLMKKVLSMAWHTRTRYRPMALLLPYIACRKLVSENPKLQEDLMRCLKTNHMAATASDVYRVFLQQIVITEKENCAKVWKDAWMSTLLRGLTSQDRLQSMKTCTYWLPITLKLVSGSHNILIKTLEEKLSADKLPCREQWLFAWITVSRTARDILHAAGQVQLTSFLKEALSSDSDEIRSEAVLFLSSTVKKAEPVSDLELNLLQEFLPANLKTDSAPFRQNLTTSVRKLLVRIRDSSWAAIKSGNTKDSYVNESLCFVDWLYKLLMLSLAPGGSYHRRQTTFDILTGLFEVLVFQEEDTSKKGKAPESAGTLIQFAQGQGLWDFFKEDHFWIVLVCLDDGAEEIQMQCYRLLLKYFPWPKTMAQAFDETSDEQNITEKDFTNSDLSNLSPSSTSTLLARKATILHLINRAFALTNRPRAYENHSGLLLMSLILNRYIMDLGLVFNPVNPAPETNISPETVTSDCAIGEGNRPEYAFVDLLVAKLKFSLNSVRGNLANDFKIHPVHGLTQCITRSLLDITSAWKNSKVQPMKEWGNTLEEIVTVNQEIIDLVLDVMAGGKALENCPSFADMGVALKNLISTGQEQDEEVMSISPEFQLLLSWCWINLKESCTCLGNVTSMAVLDDGNHHIPEFMLSNIGQTFVRVLTTCRHRGAIEGCRGGLTQFSMALMSSSATHLSNIPKLILQLVVASLSENSLTSSVTRRSAGLPIIVQTVLQAARKCGDASQLHFCVEQLYNIASQPLPSDHNQELDLSQSHALNILKVIFCDASLAPLLMPSLSKMTILVIEGFDSPSWAIRNAATQLISTLVTRIFGQKNKVDNSSSMTLEEFASVYPELLDFICRKLRTYMVSVTTVRPSLYIVLTVLSGLGMSPSHQHSSSCRLELQESVSFFLSSPVYSLRKLSCQAYVALSPLDKTDILMEMILGKIRQKDLKMNQLHGWVLCAHLLVSTNVVSPDTCKKLLCFVMENKWLLFGCPSCLLVSSTVLQTVRLSLGQDDLDGQFLQQLWLLITDFMTDVGESTVVLQVDRYNCLQECVKTKLALQKCINSRRDACEPELIQFILDGLSSSHTDIKEAVLDCLHHKDDINVLTKDTSIQKALWTNMMNETNLANFERLAKIVVTLKLNNSLHLQPSDLLNFDTAVLKSHVIKEYSSEASVFLVRGIIFSCSNFTQQSQRISSLCEWCKHLLNLTSPSANENLRFTAAQALRMSGENILKFCCTNRDLAGVEGLVISLMKASLQLLEDSEADVRHEVSLFVSKQFSLPSLHYNLCYAALSQLICEQFLWCRGLISTLIDILYKPGDLTSAITSALNTELQPLFEPDTSSALSEIHITKLWAYKTLEMINRQEDIIQPHLTLAIDSATSDLLLHMSVLKENLSSKPLFNISSEENVLASLLGIFLLDSLHKKLGGNVESTKCKVEIDDSNAKKLNKLVLELKQISSTYPFLQSSNFEGEIPYLCNLLHHPKINP